MQKKIIFQGIFLLMLVALLAGCQKQDTNLEVDLEVGYDQVVKISEGNPLNVTMRNAGEAVSGEIQIDIATDGQSQIVFAVPFDISQGAEKVLDVYIPVYTVQKEFPVRIVVDNTTVYEQKVKARQFLSPERAVIAVISEQPDHYRFFNQMHLSAMVKEEELYTYDRVTREESNEIAEVKSPHVIFFDSVEAFNERQALDFFDYIYLGNTSNLGFNAGVEKNIIHWMQQGNTLFVETGANYQRMMNQLPEGLKHVAFNEAKEVSLDFSEANLPFVGDVVLATGNPLNEDVVFIEQQESILGYGERIGAGKLITLSMDLTADPLAQWNTGGIFLSHLMQVLDVQQQMSPGEYEEYYGNNSYRLRYIPMEKKPPYGLMALILGIYSILVGPITYFVLKKKDRRDLMWIIVPTMAIVCVVIIYLFGFMTRYDKPISNSISEINYHQGERFLEINSEIALFNNKNNQMTVSWDSEENFRISSLNTSRYYGENRESKKTKGKLFMGSRGYYESYDTTLWEPTFAVGKKVIPIEKQVEDETVRVNVIDEKVELTVFNPTPIELEYTVAIWGGQMFEVGTLEAYGQKTVSVEGVADVYDYLEKTYQMSQHYQNPGKFSEQLRSDVSFLEDNLYRSYDRNRNRSSDQVMLIGINKDDVGYAIEINDKEVEEYSRNLVALAMDYRFDFAQDMTLPYGFIQPSIMLERYGYMEEGYSYFDGDAQIIDLYETEKAFFTWKIPEDIAINKLMLKLEKLYTSEAYYEKYRNNSSQNTSNEEPVAIYIQNVQTEQWELIDMTQDEIDINLETYVSEENTLAISYDLTELKIMNMDYTMIVPAIRFEGGAVND